MSGRDGLKRANEWRLIMVAFAIWAVNFVMGYAAVLIQPMPFGKAVILIAAVLSMPAYAYLWRLASTSNGQAMVRTSVLISVLAVLFNALVITA